MGKKLCYTSHHISEKIKGRVISLLAAAALSVAFLPALVSTATAAPAGSDQPVTMSDLTNLILGQSGDSGNSTECPCGYIPMSWDEDAHEADDELTPADVERKVETPIKAEGADEEDLSAETAFSDALPSAYPYAYTNTTNLKSYFANSLMPTRSQSPFGSCWAHSTCALLELYQAKQQGGDVKTIDLSERHLARYTFDSGSGQTVSLSDTGDTYAFDQTLITDNDKKDLGITASNVLTIGQKENYYLHRGGNLGLAGITLAKWKGAATESKVPYPTSAITATTVVPTVQWNPTVEFYEDYRMKNMYMININENPDLVKRYIREYGGVGTSLYFLEALYDSTNNSYYCPVNLGTNHAVTIVGWDDSYPASKFIELNSDYGRPSSNGAWLIRNSWDKGSTDFSMYSYFWLSYEDKSIMETAYVFTLQENRDHLDHNYYYDGYIHSSYATSYSESGNRKAANAFTIPGGVNDNPQMLEAVSLQVMKSTGGPAGDITCQIDIYKNLENTDSPISGTKVYSQETLLPLNGIYTIPLEEGVLMEPGETFSIVVTLDGGKRSVDYEYDYGSVLGSANNAISVNTGYNSYGLSYFSYYGDSGWQKASDVNGSYSGDYCIGAQTIEVPRISVALDKSDPSAPKTTISWTKPSMAQGYELRSSKTKDGTYSTVFTTDNASQNSITKSVSELGGKYYKIYRRVAGVTNENSGSLPVYISTSGTTLETLSSADFSVNTALAEGEYDGAQHAVSAAGPSGYDGNITVYYQKVKDASGNETDGGSPSLAVPVNAGTYHVYVSSSETERYFAADMLTEDTWEFTIAQKLLNQQNTVIVTGDDPVYDGSGKLADITSVACGTLSLTESDYSVTYPTTHTDAGTYRCQIIGKGNFKGSVNFDLIIKPADLSGAIVTTSSSLSYKYDGAKKEPAGSYVSVKLGGKNLTTNDYTLSYKNNIHAGSAADGEQAPTVVVTGKGNYTGEASAAFSIGKRTLTVRADSVSKTEGEEDPQLTYQISNAVLGETPCFTGNLERTAGEEPGYYQILVGTLELADGEGFRTSDYSFSFTGNYLYINEKQKFWVNFYANGGMISSQYVKDGEKVDVPEVPTQDYYTFDGWYSDYNDTDPYDFNTPVTKSISLFAKWKCLHPKEFNWTQNACDAYCEADGYSGDIYCGICGELLETGKAVKATGHHWDEGYIFEYPTEYSTGIKRYTCTNCWTWKDETIDMLPSGQNGNGNTDTGYNDGNNGNSGYSEGGYVGYDEYDDEDYDEEEDEEEDYLDPKTEKALNKAGYAYIGDGAVSF
ncbi:MAG: InlB B-repeat-containing protein, partial [Lachnospiraceae bacterium]|nr:InlB B-repeat-containing protein [Lachnospiraceae bacterium]